MIYSSPVLTGIVLSVAMAACPLDPHRSVADRAGCPEPAPLLGERSEASGYIVIYHEGTAAAEVTPELARKYVFTPRHIFEHAVQGFAADLSDSALAGIRCDPVVKHVEYEGIITVR